MVSEIWTRYLYTNVINVLYRLSLYYTLLADLSLNWHVTLLLFLHVFVFSGFRYTLRLFTSVTRELTLFVFFLTTRSQRADIGHRSQSNVTARANRTDDQRVTIYENNSSSIDLFESRSRMTENEREVYKGLESYECVHIKHNFITASTTQWTWAIPSTIHFYTYIKKIDKS